MRILVVLLRAVLLPAILAADGLVVPAAAPQSMKRSAPMPEQLANLSFAGIEKTPVLLRQGVWEGNPLAQAILREEPVKNVGTLSLRDLAVQEWRLTRLTRISIGSRTDF